MLENYWKILTVTLITCLWAEELDRLARSQTLFLESAGAPSPPVTTGTTAAFTLHIFSSSSFSLQYFSSFTCSFFQMLLAVTWDCYIYHHCLLLMVLHHNYVVVGSWLWHSPPSERSPVLTLGLPAYTQMFLYTMPATWLWCSMYALPACILQSAVMCWMVSVAHLHSLHLGVVDVGLRQSVLCFGPAVPSHW